MFEDKQTIIYRYNRKIGLAHSVIMLAITIFFIKIFFFSNTSDAESGNPLFGIGLVFVYIQINGIIGSLYLLIKNRPKLTISPHGIHFEGFNNDQIYSWKEVGPFSAINTKKRKFLFARKDDTHDALIRSGKNPAADIKNAEILINYGGITDLLWPGKADEALEKINDFRQKYGAPDVPKNRYKSDEDKDRELIANLQQKLVNQEKKNWFKFLFILFWNIVKIIFKILLILYIIAFGAQLHLFFQRLLSLLG